MARAESRRQLPASSGKSEPGFFERLFGALFGLGDPEREKRKHLRQIGKALSKDRFKFYHPRAKEVQPNLARFLYEIYRTISAVRRLVQPSDASGSLKMVVIESRFTEQQLDLRASLDEKSIRERARQMDVKDLAEAVKDSLLSFVATFDALRVKEVNQLYNQVQAFVGFCHFDYYFTLKKFDSAITEDSFTYKPRFDNISANYITDDLRDFLDAAISLPPDTDWALVFDILSAYRGIEIIDRDQWRKVEKTLREILKTGVMELIVRHVAEQPEWVAKGTAYNARIVEPYLNDIKVNVENTLSKIAYERRNNRIEQLVKQVFGTTSVSRTKNYTARANEMFSRVDTGGFRYTEAVNYLKAYLLDAFKKDVREIVQDLLIVRGRWTTNIQAQQLSDAYHGVMQTSDQIIKFDDSLSENGEVGQKLRRAMGRVVDRDPTTQRPLKALVDQINGEAARMVNETAQNLITIGKNLKMLIDDFEKRENQIIINWRELDVETDHQLKNRMATLYKQLYYLVQLLQVYSGKS